MGDHEAKDKGMDRRGPDRRQRDVPVEVDRRKAVDRRSKQDRRQKAR